MKLSLGDYLATLNPSELDRLAGAFELASIHDSDLEPTQVREMVPVRPWLRSRYYNSFSQNLYPYWEEEIADFIEGEFTEWVVTGSIGTGKSSAALIAAQRKIYELSCWDFPQRLFRLADMTKIFFAYLSVNLKQADLTGFGQLREMVDATPYFKADYSRDMGIQSVLKFPRGVFVIPGSDAISVIGTNLFGTILDEANFLRKSGMSAIGDVAKAQELYAETTDRRRSRFMYKGKDPGFSILVSSSTVQTSFTSSRIEKADETVKVTCTKLWEVKPTSYSDKRFYVFNGSEKDDPFILTTAKDLEDVIESAEDKEALTREADACCLEGEEQVAYIVEQLPDYLYDAISVVPTDFRKSFETDLYKALRNIAGVSIAPVGKLFSSRLLWNKATDNSLVHPFRKREVVISLQGEETLRDYFRTEFFFSSQGPKRHPEALRYFHIDLCKNKDKCGIACVHQAGSITHPDIGLILPLIEADFVLQINPPKPPDKLALYKVREFVMWLRSLGMQIGRVTYDQYQSEDSIQLLGKRGIDAGNLSIDRNDKAYLTLVSVLHELRLQLYDYPVLKKELFNLDWSREHQKVDHPDKNPDGSEGSKDVTDALAGAVFNCVFGQQGTYIERKDALSKVKMIAPISSVYEEENFSWLLPVEYQGKVEIEYEEVGGDLFGGESVWGSSPFSKEPY